jgi:hypothetical protein
MCQKCTELEFQTAKYRGLLLSMTDQLARDAITGLIEQMTKDKAALHPKERPLPPDIMG